MRDLVSRKDQSNLVSRNTSDRNKHFIESAANDSFPAGTRNYSWILARTDSSTSLCT